MEDLITNAHILFQQSGSNSPPLPSAPLNESAAQITYGSQHTKVLSSMPPPPVPTSPRRGHQKSSSVSTIRSSLDVPRPQVPPQDFTPQLPPRPANSIHPSLRAGPHASPARQMASVRTGQFFDDDMLITPQSSISSRENGSSTSLPPIPLPHFDEEAESEVASTAIESTRESSSKQPSRQTTPELPPRPVISPVPPQSLDQPAESPYPSPYSPHPPPSLRSASHETGIEMSSTATAAAFASATPSPTSSCQSSPSKRSAGHSRKDSD